MGVLIGFLVFGAVFVIAVIVMLTVMSNRKKEMIGSQQRINQKAVQALKDKNFDASKVYYLNDFATYDKTPDVKKMIAVDNNGNRIAFVNYASAGLAIIDFKDIVNYEVYENGSAITSGGAIGGVFAGAFGAENSGSCKNLRLIVRSNDLDKPHITYDIISNTPFNFGIGKTSKIYSECVRTLQEFVSFLEVVKNQNADPSSAMPAKADSAFNIDDVDGAL